jgi:hypothetical protein
MDLISKATIGVGVTVAAGLLTGSIAEGETPAEAEVFGQPAGRVQAGALVGAWGLSSVSFKGGLINSTLHPSNPVRAAALAGLVAAAGASAASAAAIIGS